MRAVPSPLAGKEMEDEENQFVELWAVGLKKMGQHSIPANTSAAVVREVAIRSKTRHPVVW